MNQPIIYESASTDLLKTALKFERCINSIRLCVEEGTLWSIEAALFEMLYIIRIIDKPELRSKLYQTYVNIEKNLIKFNALDGVNSAQLDEVLDSARQQLALLNATSGKFNAQLLNIPFLNHQYQNRVLQNPLSKKPSQLIQLWLHKEIAWHQQQFRGWLESLDTIENSFGLLLKLLRETASFEPYQTTKGYLQLPTDSQKPQLLIRVKLHQKDCYPEINIGHHGFAIQFIDMDFITQPTKRHKELNIDLAICQM